VESLKHPLLSLKGLLFVQLVRLLHKALTNVGAVHISIVTRSDLDCSRLNRHCRKVIFATVYKRI
jgi:hypothetical protein